ncbi:MAG: phosphatidate cytidylyltransferase [Candidatus Marinimicrobia bacterium]|nr:phosphatidate cytidylyltransferase [Candidatus Neomarinimicrobiota bacterium]MCF7880586.1 phosphatidate cytidylyltransferase [Candidatus Neomarinimicrobiota bacterium]
MSEAIQRITVSIIGIPLILAAIWFGQYYFLAFVAAVALLGLSELFSMAKTLDIVPSRFIGGIATLGILWAFYIGTPALIITILISATLLSLFLEMVTTSEQPLQNVSVTLFGLLYLGVGAGSMIGIRESGVFNDYIFTGQLVILIFAGVWICDTVAYFLGIRFGKHRLFEKVSPKKSVEGAVAGLLGAMAFVFGVYFSELVPGITLRMAVILAIIIGISGQAGDLMESWLKRRTDIKDSSSLIPGHGGVLDRFDSLLVVSPLIFIAIQLDVF